MAEQENEKIKCIEWLEEKCRAMFPPGKRYASQCAFRKDVQEWGQPHGFGVALREDEQGVSLGCFQHDEKYTNNDQTGGCTFRIHFERHDDNTVEILNRSTVYRHSCTDQRNHEKGHDSKEQGWIQLVDGKEFSRLLYTNPVCFLGTYNRRATETEASTTNEIVRNVMILSWLTATNNEGSFMFSLNKNRYTASILSKGFVLSVPVQGMEDLVLNVGSVSGRWGVSKFPADHSSSSTRTMMTTTPTPTTSHRKKHKGPRFPYGIPGLETVALGHATRVNQHNTRTEMEKIVASGCDDKEQWPFAIQGTVAHLLCQVIHVANEPTWADDGHYIVFAKVIEAYVHPSYWDASKKLFRPSSGRPPYLTFFGSQTFGYVSADPL